MATRLEKGRCGWPFAADAAAALTPAQRAMLLEGIDWRMPLRTDRPTIAGCQAVVVGLTKSARGGIGGP